jgi:hypothetical protein
MAFVCIAGVKGKAFAPDARRSSPKKHPCQNCFACQFCGDDRCTICRAPASGPDANNRYRRDVANPEDGWS